MHCVEWYMRFVALHIPLVLGVKVLHNEVVSVDRLKLAFHKDSLTQQLAITSHSSSYTTGKSNFL